MAGDPDILVDLTTARTEFEAETIAESLRAQGVPAQTFAIAGSVLQWDVAITQPIRVVVCRRDLALAQSILRAIRAESVDLDWSEVDTGDRTPVTDAERTAEQDVAARVAGSKQRATSVPSGSPGGSHRALLGTIAFWFGLIMVLAAGLFGFGLWGLWR